ncbi:MAG: pilus assembly protein PilP [Acidobacteriota bacterium]|nr:pilus assembly protein PilP [Acidobacteriota bacterium]
MTRFARHCVSSVAVLVAVLSLGTAIWAQGKAVKKAKPPRKAHSASKAKVPAKPAAKATPATPVAVAATATPASNAAPAESDASIDLVGKRDPFVALVNTSKGGAEHLPPGKAGLVIGTLTVQGTVQGANGMIAVIANPDQRVYFVREGDRLYDGDVQKISLDGVTFEQNTKDAFGKPIERTVVKRIYPSAGEQQ